MSEINCYREYIGNITSIFDFDETSEIQLVSSNF